MNSKKVHETIENIILFPGSLDELNKIEELSGSGRQYQLTPVEGGKKYILGTITPSITDMQESILSINKGMGMIKDLSGFMGVDMSLDEEEKSQMAEKMTELEQFAQKMLKNPAVIEADIRTKAKKIGADGLIHVQMYDKEKYFGVPIKLAK